MISLRDRLYIWVNGIYEYNIPELESAIRRLDRGAKVEEINTTLKDLFSIATPREETGYDYLAFNNYIVNIKTLEPLSFDYDKYVITSKVYAAHDTSILTTDTTSVQLVDKFFNNITRGDVELQNFLFEIICYCKLRTAKYQRAFILYGNSKSDYLYIISKLLGDYCTHENLLQLSNINNLRYYINVLLILLIMFKI